MDQLKSTYKINRAFDLPLEVKGRKKENMRKTIALTLDTYDIDHEETRGRKAILSQVERFIKGRRDALTLSWGCSDIWLTILESRSAPLAIVSISDGRACADPDDIEEIESYRVLAWLSKIGIAGQDDGDDVYVRMADIPALVTALMDTTEKEVMKSLW